MCCKAVALPDVAGRSVPGAADRFPERVSTPGRRVSVPGHLLEAGDALVHGRVGGEEVAQAPEGVGDHHRGDRLKTRVLTHGHLGDARLELAERTGQGEQKIVDFKSLFS